MKTLCVFVALWVAVCLSQEDPPLPPPTDFGCGPCIMNGALFFEDAFYSISTDQYEGEGRENAKLFCQGESRLHPEWSRPNPQEFRTQCHRQYSELARFLSLTQEQEEPFNPFHFARRSCVKNEICSPVERPEDENEEESERRREFNGVPPFFQDPDYPGCGDCMAQEVVFSEDVKYFSGVVSETPNEQSEVERFCETEATLHPQWPSSMGSEEFMEQCREQYHGIVGRHTRPSSIRPYRVAERLCVKQELCSSRQQIPQDLGDLEIDLLIGGDGPQGNHHNNPPIDFDFDEESASWPFAGGDRDGGDRDGGDRDGGDRDHSGGYHHHPHQADEESPSPVLVNASRLSQ